MFRCVVEVMGIDGKFASDRATFDVKLPFAPSIGDELVLEPGGGWGTVSCVVTRRIVSEDGVRLVAKVV